MTPVEWRDSTESTNGDLRVGSVAHGDTIATLQQTAGRGRLGRTWADVPGKGLAVSVVLTEPIAVLTLIPLIAGAAAIEVITALSGTTAPWMKWPNDVYFDEKKVAGILTELPEPGRLIVGLGLNLFHDANELPVDTATSLAVHGVRVDPIEFVEAWRAELLRRAALVTEASTVDWVNSHLGLRDENVRIDLADGTHRTGVVRGVAADGALILDSGDPVVAGDITRLRPTT